LTQLKRARDRGILEGSGEDLAKIQEGSGKDLIRIWEGSGELIGIECAFLSRNRTFEWDLARIWQADRSWISPGSGQDLAIAGSGQDLGEIRITPGKRKPRF
tara:strand:- start:1028 stop:1333 length:306 start_codon:yes stop_codon:yes gene_type:complete